MRGSSVHPGQANSRHRRSRSPRIGPHSRPRSSGSQRGTPPARALGASSHELWPKGRPCWRVEKYLSRFRARPDLGQAHIIIPVVPWPISAGMPHAHFVRGPTPGTILAEEASYKMVASGHGLSAVPAAREALNENPERLRIEPPGI